MKRVINNKKIVVILGMHRSGTSMVAGVLTKLGFNMGEDLIEKDPTNPFGHFEDREFVDLNRQILNFAGGDWDSPSSQKAILSSNKKFNEKIRKLINSKDRRFDFWGWKDPRTSLTISLYMPYLNLANTYFILCTRDHQEIAQSLFRRNGIKIKNGKNLAKIYDKRTRAFLSKHPEIPILVLGYEQVTRRPKESVDNIIKFLDLKVDRREYQNAVRFVLPNEKVHKISNRLRTIELIKEKIKQSWKIPEFIFNKK